MDVTLFIALATIPGIWLLIYFGVHSGLALATAGLVLFVTNTTRPVGATLTQVMYSSVTSFAIASVAFAVLVGTGAAYLRRDWRGLGTPFGAMYLIFWMSVAAGSDPANPQRSLEGFRRDLTRVWGTDLANAAVRLMAVFWPLFPGSVLLISVAATMDESIGRLFLAVTPIYALALALCTAWLGRYPLAVPKGVPENQGHSELGGRAPGRGRILWSSFFVYFLVIYAIYAGFFTPTEAIAFWALFSLPLWFRHVFKALQGIAHIFLVFAGINIYSLGLVFSGSPRTIVELVASSGMSFGLLLAVLFLVGALFGYFFELLVGVLVLLALTFPTAREAGLDPNFYFVFVVLALIAGHSVRVTRGWLVGRARFSLFAFASLIALLIFVFPTLINFTQLI